MELESLRENLLGKFLFTVVRHDNMAKYIVNEYEIFSRKAFLFSLDAINRLEKMKRITTDNDMSLTTIPYIFLALEAFASDIVKIILFSRNKEIENLHDRNVYQKLCLACDELGIDHKYFMKTKNYNKIKEFCTFRNSLFHLSKADSRHKFKHTQFSEIPLFANQSDIIQAMDILISTISMFRYIFYGIDLMPHIPIHKKDKCIFVKIDEIYENVIIKTFNQALDKHNLTTNIERSLSNFTFLPCKDIFLDPIIITKQDKEYNLSTQDTNYLSENYNSYIEEKIKDMPEDTMKLPSVIIKNTWRYDQLHQHREKN